MNKKLILTTVSSLVFCFALSSLINAQEKAATENSPKGSTKINKVVSTKGWDISFLDAKKLSRDKYVNILGYSVSEKTFALSKTVETKIDNYNLLTDDQTLVFSSLNVEVRSVVSYSLNEKIFGYRIWYTPYEVSADGTKNRLAAHTAFYYCDEDGDGKFETRYQSAERPEQIPGWVKENKK